MRKVKKRSRLVSHLVAKSQNIVKIFSTNN
jgi:hypothetical protein